MKASKYPKVLVISSVDPFYGPAIVGLNHYNAIRRGGCEVDFLTKYPVEGHPEFISVYDQKPKKPSQLARVIKKIFRILGIGALNRQSLDNVFYYEKETDPTVPVGDVLRRINKPYDVVYIMFWQGVLSFAHIEAIYDKLKCQIQFRCVDYSPMSGGCHFTGDCQRFEIGCGCCPGIRSKKENDFTRFNINYRKRVYDKVKPIVYGNTYMNTIYRRSYLLKDYDRVEVVYPLSDNETYHPLDMDLCRKKYNINSGKSFLILFGCQHLNDPRKGMTFLLEAIKQFHKSLTDEERKNVLLVIIGHDIRAIKDQLFFEYQYLGYVNPVDLPAIYSMSNLFLSPSVNDAGPSMVNQAMSCGTPVVSFEMGTALDVVKGRDTGYCAKLRDPFDFAKGISHIFNLSENEYAELRSRCRKVALDLTSEVAFFNNFMSVYEKYLTLA